MKLNGYELLLFSCNTLILLWGYWPIRPTRPIPRWRSILACAVLILLRLPLYLFVDLVQPTWLQSILRFLPCVVYLRLAKEVDWKRCFYFACITWIGFTLCANVFRTPWLGGMTLGRFAFTSSDSVNRIIGTILEHGLDFLVITALTRLIPLNNIRSTWSVRTCLLTFVIICQLYIIQTLESLSQFPLVADLPELTIYLIIMQLFVAGGLILFERYLVSTAEWERARVAELDARYRYESLRQRQEGELNIRRLHHDMKNHLLTIRRLSDRPDAQNAYLSNLLEKELSAMEGYVQTGNSLLDGLLDEKMAQAKSLGIQLSVTLDFRPCAYIDGTDVCAIFGNIVDNAIEATAQLEDTSQRVISLSSRQAADRLVISCANPYKGTLHQEERSFISSKTAPGHGIGLHSIRRSVEKYGGVLTIDTAQPDIFRLILMLPTQITVTNG